MNEPLRQRRPPLEDLKYLERLRQLPCVVCGAPPPSDASHIRMSGVGWGPCGDGKESTGMGEKPSDNYAVPLCRPVHKPDTVARIFKPDKPLKVVSIGCHARQHSMSEEEFWRKVGKNPFQIASVLYAKFGSGLVVRKKKRRPKDGHPKPKRAPRTSIKPKGFGGSRKIESRGFDKTVKRKIPSRNK